MPSILIQAHQETHDVLNRLAAAMTAVAIFILIVLLAGVFMITLSSGMSHLDIIGNSFNAVLGGILSVCLLLGVGWFLWGRK